MGIRILLVLVVLSIFNGCGEPSSPPEQGEKEGAAGPKSRSPSGSGQQETTHQETTLQHEFTGNESTRSAQPQIAEEMNDQHQTQCAEDSDRQRQESRSNTRAEMAFSENYDIWTMDADGTHLKRLTDTDEFEESDPALSPDGSRIAYTRAFYEEHSSASSVERYDLFIMHTDGSCQTELVHSIASEPAWSPDGKRIAFTGLRRSDGDGSSIYVLNTDGSGEPHRLTSGARGRWDNSPAWSPDGTEIAFVSNRPEGRPLNSYSDIYVTKACCKEGAANRPQRLTDTHGWNRDPAWSPDGTELAFTFVDFGSVSLYGTSRVLNTDIYTMKSDGSGETRLNTFADKGTEHDPAWSPSGSEVALIRSSGYYPGTPGRASGTLAEIYVMKSDGSDPTIVRKLPGAVAWDLDWR